MQVQELDAVILLLRRILQSWGSKSVYAQHLRRLLRELVALRRGGKVPPRRLIRIVALIGEISEILCAMLDEAKRSGERE